MSQQISKAAVIGIDGADFDVIGGLIERGKLPNLEGLMERGAWAKLRSVSPPISSAAWTSMCTGVNPGRHGLLGFARTINGAYAQELIRSSHVAAPQLWDFLGPLGKRSLVFGLPNLYPPVALDGVMITGLLTPHKDSPWCHPPELQARLVEQELGFRIRPTVGELQRMGGQEAIELLRAHVRRQGETIRHLLAAEEWDLLFCVFDTSDLVQHAYLGGAYEQADQTGKAPLDTEDGRVVAEHFIELDGILGELLEALGDQMPVLVVSDHGFAKRTRLFYLNQWLADEGFLRRSPRITFGASTTNWRRRRVAEVLSSLRLGFITALLPASVRDRELAAPRLGRILGARAPLWSATRAYLDPTAFGFGVRVNLQGREPGGIVSPGEEYEALREEIIAGLLAVRDPDTGEAPVRHAWKREEVHPGEHNQHEPDILVDLREDFRPVVTYGPRHVGPASPEQRAFHSDHGILVAAGPGIRAAGDLGTASILDIAPSVLSLMGVDARDVMEGEVSGCVESGIVSAARPVEDVGSTAGRDSAADGEQDAVEERLRDLGYL